MSARIIRKSELDRLRGIDAQIASMQAEMAKRRQDLEAERIELLEKARERALRDSTQTAARIVIDAEAAAQSRLKSLEPQVAELVSETVAQIIGEMDRHEVVMRATKQALSQLKEHRQARILAAPDIAEPVRRAVQEVGEDSAEIVSVEVDARLEPGRTVLSSDRGHVEIGLDDQLAAATEIWRERI